MKSLSDLQQDWNDLADIDAMWSICSDPEMQYNRWDQETFFETGREDIRKILNVADKLGVRVQKGRVLDFGCGIGRLTQALAEEFDDCYGVDISPKMIQLAEGFNQFGNRVKYVLNQRDDLRVFADNYFDFIYTIEVLQHMNPILMQKYLQEFIRILNAGGVLIFQVPIHHLVFDEKTSRLKSLPLFHPKRVLNKFKGLLIGHDDSIRYYRLRKFGFSKKWLYDHFGLRPTIEMYCLDETLLFKIFEGGGAELISLTKSPNVPGDLLMGTYIAVKHSEFNNYNAV